MIHLAAIQLVCIAAPTLDASATWWHSSGLSAMPWHSAGGASANMVALIPFMHPGLALAALGAALIPLVIHVLSRRRFRRVPWAAMRFLASAMKRSARRIRIEHWILLALRTVVIACVAGAIARPFLSGSWVGPARPRALRVVVIDDSLSMSAIDGGATTRFSKAIDSARKLVEQFPSEDAVALVTASSPVRSIIEDPTCDRRMVRDRLDALTVTHRVDDLPAALAKVQVIVSNNARFAPGNAFVYVISDMSRTTKLAEKRSAGATADALASAVRDISKKAAVTLLPIGEKSAINLGISELNIRPELVRQNETVQAVATVCNYGSQIVPGAALQIEMGDRVLRRQELPALAPGAHHEAICSIAFPNAGANYITARMIQRSADAVGADDARGLSVAVRDRIQVLLVDGRPTSAAPQGEAGYLALALSPPGEHSSRALFAAKSIADIDLFEEILGEYDVIALCNVRQLSEEHWNQLSGFVSRGGGLLVFGGDLVDVESYNRLGFASGKGVLPGRIVRNTGDAEHPQDIRFAKPAQGHPLLSGLADLPDSGLFLARVTDFLLVDPAPTAQVILKYSDDNPAMIVAAHGLGRVVWMTTSANMSWTNLPAKGDYVSLMTQAADYVVPRRGEHRNLLVGQSIQEPLTAAQVGKPTEASLNGTAIFSGHLSERNAGVSYEIPSIDAPGEIQLTIDGAVQRFAVNVDAMESNVQRASDAELRTLIPEARVVSALGSAADHTAGRSAEFSTTLLIIGLVAMLIEMWTASSFGKARNTMGNAAADGVMTAVADSGVRGVKR